VPIHVLLLVLASAGIHATWNLWTKQLGPGVRSAPLLWLLTAISAVVYGPFAIALALHSHWRPDAAALGFIAVSGAIHVGYFLLLLRGYRVGDLSLVYPIARGTGPMLSAIGAVLIFAEHPTPLAIAGTLLIVAGVAILTARDLGRSPHLRAGILYGLAIGVSIAIYTLWDGWSVKRVLVPPLIFYWGGEVTRVLLFTPAMLRDRAGLAAIWRDHRPRAFGIALLSPASYILILLAMQMGALGHIAPARELSILIGAFLGGHVLGEGEKRRRLVAAAAFASGVIALALAK
jgi:drug/metabolite transporter (DMT)-like permease